jgi:uncharacterized protein with GYD domain
MADVEAPTDYRFIFLLRFTPGALQTLSQASERIRRINDFVTTGLHAFCAFRMTSGAYDTICLYQGDDKQAYQFQLYLRGLGTFAVVDHVKIEVESQREYLDMVETITKYL